MSASLLALLAIELDVATKLEVVTLLDEERTDEVAADDERIDDIEDVRSDEELRTDDDIEEMLDLLVDTVDEVFPQIPPLTTGVSIAAPLAFTCKPNAMVCPGWMLAFQLKLDAL